MGTAQSSAEIEAVEDRAEAPEEAPVRKKKSFSINESLLPEKLTSKYEMIDKIGVGSFGAVYKVRDKKTSSIRAAKYVECKESTVAEVELQAKMEDPHVVEIFDTVLLPSVKKMVIIMEYCEGGNLMEWIKRCRRHQLMNETIIMKTFRQICMAVYSCHQKRIIHRDIKPENILLDGNRKIKLADFGVARMLHQKSVAKSFCGTPPYMAPELFIVCLAQGSQEDGSLGYDGKCDVWSLGCVLWDMANTSNRFCHELSNTVGLNVAQTTESIGVREIQDLVEKDIPAEYVLTKRLLHGMLKKKPEQRMSLSEVLQDGELREILSNPPDGHWSRAL